MFSLAQLEVFYRGYIAGATCVPLLIRAEREHEQPLGVATNPLTKSESLAGPWALTVKDWSILYEVL